jgi:hypothetical protein
MAILSDNITTDKDKLIRFLFLNIAYLLKQSRDRIKYEGPQYGDIELGFAVTMFRVDHKAYDYATEYFRLMGKEVVRECGVTMSVSFDTPEENNAFRDRFKALMDHAEEELAGIGDRTPHEHYFLKCNPVIVGTEDGESNHWIYLQAEIKDDLDRHVCEDILGDSEISGDDGRMEIKVSCYRKKWRDKMVRYLRGIGIKKIPPY